MFKLKALSQVIAATVATSFLVGCGGGSSSGSGSESSDTTEVSGSVFASYVAGAQLVVTDGVNKIAGPVKTDAMGNFKITLGNAQLKNNLFFVATGGSYTDEATGTAGVNSERLAVYAGANTLGSKSSINATPGSSLIELLISEYGLAEADAKAAFMSAFGYEPDITITPVDATQDNSSAIEGAKRAGVRAAAFSQLLKNLDLEAGDHKALLDALAEDLVDGEVDGMNGTTPVQLKGGDVRRDMASQFAVALMDFANDTDRNKSGLSLGQLGSVPFISKAKSENYYYELAPKGMVKEGKVTFDLTIKDSGTEGSSSSPQAGLQPMMMPMMYMGTGHMHSTPNSGCSLTDDDGVAECTAYFLMPSMMGNSDVMGNWDLKFSVAGKNEVHFFPKVEMAMGDDTSKLMLMGDDFPVMGMDGNPASRSYFIYKHSVEGATGDHTVRFFVATKDDMKNFPLLDDTGASKGALKDATVSLIVNGAAAIPEGNGVWRADNVIGLTDGELGSVNLKLSVDSQFKMLDEGNSDTDKTETAFKLTPSSRMSM